VTLPAKNFSLNTHPFEFCPFLAEKPSTYARSPLFMGLWVDFEEVSNFLMLCPFGSGYAGLGQFRLSSHFLRAE
jgi:hypothetical protein